MLIQKKMLILEKNFTTNNKKRIYIVLNAQRLQTTIKILK